MTDIKWKTFYLVSTEKCIAMKEIKGAPFNIPKKMEDLIPANSKLTLQQLAKLIKGGSARYNQTQVRMGKRVELEHSKSIILATLIALHHLDEIPNYYYTELRLAEKRGKQRERQRRSIRKK